MVQKDKAPTIHIAQEWRQRAREFALRATGETYNRFGYESNTRVNKVYVGKLGEEILRDFFIKNGLDVDEIDYNVYEGTLAIDETDLVVGKCLVDVKVGTKDFHKRLLVVKQYFDNEHQSDFYVAINLYDNEKLSVIFGYALKEEIANAPCGKFDKVRPVNDYYLFYNSLKPIEDLVDFLQNNS